MTVHCSKCDHHWEIDVRNIDMGDFSVQMMKIVCPKCAATSRDIVLGSKK